MDRFISQRKCRLSKLMDITWQSFPKNATYDSISLQFSIAICALSLLFFLHSPYKLEDDFYNILLHFLRWCTLQICNQPSLAYFWQRISAWSVTSFDTHVRFSSWKVLFNYIKVCEEDSDCESKRNQDFFIFPLFPLLQVLNHLFYIGNHCYLFYYSASSHSAHIWDSACTTKLGDLGKNARGGGWCALRESTMRGSTV